MKHIPGIAISVTWLLCAAGCAQTKATTLEVAPPTDQARTAATGNSRELANWRQLERRMTMDQVRALLGEPERVTADPFYIRWYWGDSRGGNVYFDADSRRVEGWSEPSR